jgi:hypothetical protein
MPDGNTLCYCSVTVRSGYHFPCSTLGVVYGSAALVVARIARPVHPLRVEPRVFSEPPGEVDAVLAGLVRTRR